MSEGVLLSKDFANRTAAVVRQIEGMSEVNPYRRRKPWLNQEDPDVEPRMFDLERVSNPTGNDQGLFVESNRLLVMSQGVVDVAQAAQIAHLQTSFCQLAREPLTKFD